MRRFGTPVAHDTRPAHRPPFIASPTQTRVRPQFLMSFKACVSCSGHGYPILMQDDDPSNHAECPSGACEQPRFAVPRAIPRSSRSVGRLWRVPFAFRIGVHKRQRRSAGKRQPADAGGWNATPALQSSQRPEGYILRG
jgi:hypothetical protein